MLKAHLSDKLTSEEAVRNWLNTSPGLSPVELGNLLEESHPVYKGLGSAAVSRIRGAVLMAFSQHPLPDNCLPFLLEELETPHDAYLTAVAAYCIRTAAQPSKILVQPLLNALALIRHQDDVVRLFEYGGQGRGGSTTTATTEVCKTLGWLGGHGKAALKPLREFRHRMISSNNSVALDSAIEKIASSSLPPARKNSQQSTSTCCSSAAPQNSKQVDFETIKTTRFEDETGERLSYPEIFIGQPTIVVFFYTRCENKLKCPVTISKLGAVQRLLRNQNLEGKINTAAITYDPEFDSPVRLEQYRRSWGAEQGSGFRMLRTTGGFDLIKSYFELGVSYGHATVNRHRLEVFITDCHGQVAYRNSRTQWQEQDIIDRSCELLDKVLEI